MSAKKTPAKKSVAKSAKKLFALGFPAQPQKAVKAKAAKVPKAVVPVPVKWQGLSCFPLVGAAPVEALLYFDVSTDGKHSKPCVVHSLGLPTGDDDPMAQTELDIDALFNQFIDSNIIPDNTATQAHKDLLLDTLAQWQDAVRRAQERVTDLRLRGAK